MPRLAFVLTGSLTSASYNKGSARSDGKDFDNLKTPQKVNFTQIMYTFQLKKGLDVNFRVMHDVMNVCFT